MRCSICKHPQVSFIESSIKSGHSNRQVAEAFGVGKDAVNRHIKAEHMLKDADAGDVVIPDGVDRLAWLEAKLESGAMRPEVARELRAIHDLRQADVVVDTITVREVDGLEDLLTSIFGALEPFPEARQALAPILKAWVTDQ